MPSAQTVMWDPHPASEYATPLPQPPPSTLRRAHVTTAAPVKRITFYKSGDSRFGGVKMAVHKRSFKCFNALLDDLSQKVPLPFGVRTVTTPRGTNTIKHLEQLQDGGCYLCSDRRQAKPINMELASKCPSIWYHHSRRPQRPETSSVMSPGHFPYRRRQILLVKNCEPEIRRSVVLSRRITRSLRVFLDEVSEVMQFHVRKLYTPEGRKIDSIQSLITCPAVLVCVGREAFSPLLLNCVKKNSVEKLPGLDSRSAGLDARTPGNGARSPTAQGARSPPHGAQSRASEYSEGQESKKNVNFGLETKKSIIHPRSDSSTRSTRFSLSSEKSYSNGINGCSQPRLAIMNDDIEKRVLVNKDGSLSLEMRVRFRLHSDETLQWSTHIKKSPSLTNDCSPLSQVQSHYFQKGQSETCSDPDSMSFDPDCVDYSNTMQKTLEANHCPCCYQQREQQYDMWENPAHKRKQSHHPHRTSHTHTVIRHTNSSSSSSSCNSRRVVHSRAQLSSCGGGSGSEQLIQEEMCVTESKVEVEQDGDTRVEVCRVSRCCSCSEVVAIDDHLQACSNKSLENELMMEEERPLSAVSSSSHVLQSLKEDQNDEDEDLPPSVSQCCQSSEPSPTSQTHRNKRPSRKNSEEEDRVPSSKSKISRASCRLSKDKTPKEEKAADDEDEEVNRVGSGLTGHTRHSGGSQKIRASNMCPNCGGCKRDASQPASLNPASPVCKKEKADNCCNDDNSDDSAVSQQSNKTNLTSGRSAALSNIREARAFSAMSGTSNLTAETEQEQRTLSVISATSHRSRRSNISHSTMSNKSRTSHKSDCREEAEGGNTEERAISSMSDKSGVSTKTCTSGKSHQSNCPSSAKVASPTYNTAVEDNDRNKERSPSRFSDSTLSAKSVKSNVMSNSGVSCRSTRQEEATEEEGGALSARSNLSVKSHKSHKSTKASKRTLSPRSEAEGDGEEMATSQMSARSAVSNKSNCKGNVAEEKENEAEKEEIHESDESEKEERAVSARSARSHKSNPNGDTCSQSHDITGDGGVMTATASASFGKSQTIVNGVVDRTSSAMSLKSSKSQATDCTKAFPHNETKQSENQELGASAMSARSSSSVSSRKSHKSDSSKYLTMGQEEIDEDKIEAAESAKSRKSVSSYHNGTADVTDIETTDPFSQNVSPKHTCSSRINSPSTCRAVSQSPRCSAAQHLLPDQSAEETRGPSVLSLHSTTSSKSGRPNCGCGAVSANVMVNEEENEEDNGEEKASEQAPSSSRHQQKESGGTEQPLSRCSSRSISLGLPEDQETGDSDSSKSRISFHTNTESKGRVKTADLIAPKSKEGSATEEAVVESKSNGSKNTMTLNSAVAEIPIIKTPAGGEDEDEDEGGTKTERAASALSAKSSKSSCKCSNIQREPVKVNNLDNPDNRPSSSMSTANAKTQNKSCPSASTKSDNVVKTPVGDSVSPVVKNRSRPVSEAKSNKETVSIHSKSPRRLRPETEASSKSRSKQREDSDCLHPVKAHKTKQKEKCQKERNLKAKEEITPAYLPSASPNEVVSHWLQSIPANSSILGLGDELEESEQEKDQDEKTEEEVEGEVERSEFDKDKEEIMEADKGEEKEEEDKCDAEQSSDLTPGDALGYSCPNHDKSLPRNWQSSVAVMKVLLNSSMGRCQSMPEVSPVYGRRLSTSARGFLDCLAQLQLIEPVVDQQKNHNQQYEDIMVILQSLWLTERRDIDTIIGKDSGPEQVTPPRSSSGVDMSSGSGGSGKENLNQERDETSKCPSADVAEKQVQSEEQSTIPPSLDSPKVTENPSSSDKSYANDSSKSPTDNETMDDTNSGTPPTVLQAPLSKISSQDPDLVWVLHLLKKLEKQFINHYVDAMAEFKVRWDLDDSLILSTMISELREEVSQRIESSIEREIRKIQSRAGRGARSPRPPQGRNLSRDSTMTEKRRRMLKVMKNQSVKTADSLSDGETTGDFSDQRSEDEYCPCDACVRKKMAARPLKTNPVATEAPVMQEFDLLKILQVKKGPLCSPVATPKSTDMEGGRAIQEEEEGRNLEVVHEEAEEEEEITKEDIKADAVLEEAIPEEDNEVEDAGKAGESKRNDNSVSVQEKREDTYTHIVEEEEETNDNTSENESADDGEKGEEKEDEVETEMGEEKSDEETVKETRAGENGEDDEEEEEEQEPDDYNAVKTQAKDQNESLTAGNEDDGGEREEKEGASTQEKAVTEGEEEEKDKKSPGDTSVDAETTGNEANETDGDDIVEEVKSGEKGDKVTCDDRQNVTVLHQFTRTSVESQPGSLEDPHPDSPQ